MSLKINLKPHEKVIIGGAVIKNGASSSHLLIENNVPILRQADILTEHEATTPCRRIYLAIQLMYIDEKNSAEIHPIYWELVRELLGAVPSMKDLISQVSQAILNDRYYQALKLTKKLMAYEEELLNNESKLG
ncbi:MAG: flagellar protein FlbT [Geobacter sp.]|nr:flagellar protein FlbT [Geobacter sp.]